MPELFKENQLSIFVSELQEKQVLELVEKLLSDGIDPLAIINQCNEGMSQVGKYYENGRYFISGLIMAGEIMRKVGQLVLPLVENENGNSLSGRIVLGTIEGDIHYVGKDIFKVLVQIHGFTVYDLGVDVSANKFLAAINEFKPDIVGISCLITSGYNSIRDTIAFLKKNVSEDISLRAYIIGGRVDDFVCKVVGADYWANEAMNGIHLCQTIMEKKIPPLKNNYL